MRNEIDEFKDINFHDAEIAKIICDYDTGTIEMPIVMDEKQRYNAILRFENILSLEVAERNRGERASIFLRLILRSL